MKKIQAIAMIVVASIMATACFHRMAPTGKGGTYNEQTNTTTYAAEPYGSIAIPGKWDGGKYNKASRNQFFYRADTSTFIASIGPCSSLPFGKAHLEGNDVVKRYFDLEVQFQAIQGTEPKVLVDDAANRYKIWMSHIDGIDQYFLFGVKDCTCNECVYRSFTLKTRKMTADESVKFLQGIFLN
jgi:hypothetical protein